MRVGSLRALPFLLRLIAIVLFLASTVSARAADDPTSVGSVNEVENEAQIVSGSGTATVVVGAPVHMKDELRTGAEGYLQVTFRDNTVLTLGENASVVINRYVFNPTQGIGEAALQVTQGAFRFATGQLKTLPDKKITVSTPVADIGVRGTEFWGGPSDGQYGVLLLEGEVSVSNQAGVVTLSKPGQGTEIHSRFEAPRFPTVWAHDKVERALGRTVTHHGHDLHQPDRGRGHNREHGPDHRSDLRGGHRPGVEGTHPPGGKAVGKGRTVPAKGGRNLWRWLPSPWHVQ
jgi:hypothetical protein